MLEYKKDLKASTIPAETLTNQYPRLLIWKEPLAQDQIIQILFSPFLKSAHLNNELASYKLEK